MKHKVLIAVSAALLLVAAGLIAVWTLGATKSVAAVGDIRLDKRTIELRAKEEIIKGNEVDFDRIVLLLAREKRILDKVKSTPQKITKKEREEMLWSAQDGYRKNKEENTLFFEGYDISEEDGVGIILAMKIRAAAEKRYRPLVEEELLSKYAEKYGEGPIADENELDELFAEHMDEMLADFPEPVYNEEEMEKLKIEIEEWKKTRDKGYKEYVMQIP